MSSTVSTIVPMRQHVRHSRRAPAGAARCHARRRGRPPRADDVGSLLVAGTPSKKRKRPGPREAAAARQSRRRRTSRATRGTSRRRPPRDWIAAARLRTLPLAFTPILIGTGAAILVDGQFHWVIALFCLIVSVSLQIGVNYANDYSDGVRGTDDHRVGPARLTASRKASPRAVLTVALDLLRDRRARGSCDRDPHASSGGCCSSAPSASSRRGSTPAASAPTGTTASASSSCSSSSGSSPPLGTTCVQVLAVPQEAWFGGVGAGLLACAVLLANNLRDIDQDRAAGKRTLTVLIGRRATRSRCSRSSCSCRSSSPSYLAAVLPDRLAHAARAARRRCRRSSSSGRTALPRELVVALGADVADVGRLRRVPVLGVRRLSGCARRPVRHRGVVGRGILDVLVATRVVAHSRATLGEPGRDLGRAGGAGTAARGSAR